MHSDDDESSVDSDEDDDDGNEDSEYDDDEFGHIPKELRFLLIYNREFEDLSDIGGCTRELLAHDRALLEMLENEALDEETALRKLIAEEFDNSSDFDLREFFFFESDNGEALTLYRCLDVGIASSVAAISALGALPYASCNGRESHHETIPLVAFLDEDVLPTIRRLATASGTHVDATDPGHIIWGDSLHDMLRFVEESLKTEKQQ